MHNEPIILLSEQETALTRDLAKALEVDVAAGRQMRLVVNIPGDTVTTPALPSIAAKLLVEMLQELGAGNGVMLVSVKPDRAAE